MSVKCTAKLADGQVLTFTRETMMEAIIHAEEVYYPMGAVKLDFQTIDNQEGDGS